ncbi:hypothetical protein [Rhizobium sp. LCM 4573]|uniref:hypothetical protein n=1 Tax=Rhizobium sp. LCM 4573 TaxID=1848291 RepID=UPI0008DB2632|nr:hypothetical protein [Rhizobium sp. LCM 4573]OHV84843.1 hypothetical protein LCM4573_04090 [Rhizobium sp. LCM 4573]
MRNFIAMLKEKFVRAASIKKCAQQQNGEMQVVVPEAVVLPLPKAPREEISVPASINGRDLSTGRL